MKKVKFEKLFSEGVNSWWDSLSHNDKTFFKEKYSKICDENTKRKFPYPNMRDVRNIKLKELSNKDIFCIWRFRDHETN